MLAFESLNCWAPALFSPFRCQRRNWRHVWRVSWDAKTFPSPVIYLPHRPRRRRLPHPEQLLAGLELKVVKTVRIWTWSTQQLLNCSKSFRSNCVGSNREVKSPLPDSSWKVKFHTCKIYWLCAKILFDGNVSWSTGKVTIRNCRNPFAASNTFLLTWDRSCRKWISKVSKRCQRFRSNADLPNHTNLLLKIRTCFLEVASVSCVLKFPSCRFCGGCQVSERTIFG